MFNDSIGMRTPITKKIWENHVLNHDSPFVYFGSEWSLLTTATILLYDRVPDFKISINNVKEDMNTLPEVKDPNVFSFVSNMGGINLPQGMEGFEELKEHEQFLKEKLNTSVILYVNRKSNTVLFGNIGAPDRRTLHAVETFFPVYFREPFETKSRTEWETRFLNTLMSKSPKAYLEMVDEALQRPDLRDYLLRTEIANLEKSMIDRQISECKNTIARHETEMKEALKKYSDACGWREDAMIRLDGLMYREENATDSGLRDYLTKNKSLTNLTIEDGKMSFIVKTFLLPYLPDSWEVMSRSANNPIFKGYCKAGNLLDDPENLKLLLDAIFSRDAKLKMRMCAYFEIATNGSKVTSFQGYDYIGHDSSLKDYKPNPHLDIYNCFGQNMMDILFALKNGDIISAVECCINVTKRINVDESTTIRRYIEMLRPFKGRCIVTPEGNELTPVQAVMYLKGETNESTVSD